MKSYELGLARQPLRIRKEALRVLRDDLKYLRNNTNRHRCYDRLLEEYNRYTRASNGLALSETYTDDLGRTWTREDGYVLNILSITLLDLAQSFFEVGWR